MIGAVVPNEGSMVTTSIHQLAGSVTGYSARALLVVPFNLGIQLSENHLLPIGVRWWDHLRSAVGLGVSDVGCMILIVNDSQFPYK